MTYPQTYNILLAMDGSEHAMACVSLLHDLDLPVGSTVTVLGVFLPRDASSFYTFQIPMSQAETDLAGRGFQVKSELLAGNPAEVITQCAEETHPDLIVLGAKGRRGTMGILLGGVAQQVVEYSNVPVLVVRTPYPGLNRIILVTDGSQPGESAANYLGQLPVPSKAQIDVVHVLAPLPLPQPMVTMPTWPMGYERGTVIEAQPEIDFKAIQEEEEKAGRELLARVTEKLRRDLFTRGATNTINGVLLQGDAATEIINYANEYEADLIIAGSRGLSQVKSWLLGSVSRKLLHYARCSVLVVRSNYKGILAQGGEHGTAG